MASLIALAGFMGSGKTAVGKALAQRLGCRFVDLDEEFELVLERAVSTYFRAEGEAAFRAAESQVLAQVLDEPQASTLVLALGGGTLQRSENIRRIRRVGRIVFLDSSPDEAWRRVSGSDRPLAEDKSSFDELWRSRRSTYLACADWVLPVDGHAVDGLAAELYGLVISSSGLWDGLWGQRLAGTARESLIVGGQGSLGLLSSRAAGARESGSALYLVSDRNVMKAWGAEVCDVLGVRADDCAYVLEPGEPSKSVGCLAACWEWLAAHRARRGDVLVVLGGGVVGDLGGFAAATYHRGMGLWQVPSSLLAQVDSSVGGKTAIDLKAGKNLAGVFYQPDLVVIDPITLTTLPQVEYIGALGEVVKHALLDSDEAVKALETQARLIAERNTATLSALVSSNVRFKASVVQEDERETGKRAILNLGHTTAHALESSLGYGRMSHGQAVALGVLVALAVSEQMLGLDVGVRQRTESLVTALGLEARTKLPGADLLLRAAAQDKKATKGTSGFVGLRAVGRPEWGLEVPGEVFTEALEVIKQ